MSHFTVLIIGNEDRIEEVLAPYNEQDEDYFEFKEEYPDVKTAVDGVMEKVNKYDHAKDMGLVEKYEEFISKGEPEQVLFDWDNYKIEDGKVGNKNNPNAKWDWWVIGGRWPDELIIKNDEGVAQAEIKDIKKECLKSLHTYAVIDKDGEWHAPGQMGWFACSTETEEEAEKWDNEFYQTFLEHLPPATVLTIVDCHI